MGTLTESAAEQLLTARSFTSGPPGFVGAAIDLPGPASTPPGPAFTSPSSAFAPTGQAFAPPGPAFAPASPGFEEGGTGRRLLRHGFLVARAGGVVTVSGPPSPGLASCLARMSDDLGAAPGVRPGGGAAAGIRVGLEAGLDGSGPLGLARRWRLAHTLAPVLAAAFANSPSTGGWRSTRAARHRDRPVLPGNPTDPLTKAAALHTEPAELTALDTEPPKLTALDTEPAERPTEPAAQPLGVPDAVLAGTFETDVTGRAGKDPRADWAAYVMDARPSAGEPSLRERLRAGESLTEGDLWRHVDSLRAPVAARGHLELDFVDGQAGEGWRVAVAVVATLLDDPVAATAAEEATGRFAYGEKVWERAARDALTDAQLATAARECFVAAYAALARRGAPRDLRDAVAAFMDRYVMRGRCPADDLIAAAHPRPIEAG
jgi:glutamate--cysteine ligase